MSMGPSFVQQERESYNVLVHYHIMKNAGSTISEILRREFNGSYAEIHGPDPGSMISTSELAAFIKEHPLIRAISSHHVRFPVPREERLHFAYCCFIRHPLDRLHSLYNFFRDTREESVVGRLAQSQLPSVFFTQMVDRFPNYVCNVQTSYLACSGFFLRPPDREDLGIAIRVIKECTLPGVVNRTNQSLAVAEYFLNPIAPGVRLHYSPQNVRRELHKSIADREYEFKAACGAKVYNQLAILNRLDLDLFRRTEEEVERRAQLIPSFASRLADFEKRCFPLVSPALPERKADRSYDVLWNRARVLRLKLRRNLLQTWLRGG